MELVEDEKKPEPMPGQQSTLPASGDADSSEVKIFEYKEVEVKPHPINIVTPVYPEKARKEKIEGKVVLKVVVNMDGSVSDVSVLEGPEEFHQAAIDAISQSQFKPAEHNGKVVPVRIVMPIEFSLGSTDTDLQLTSPVTIDADGNEVEIPRFFEVEATPELLQSVKSVYPTRVTVRLEFRVYEGGSVGDMKVLKGPEEFHQAAIDAISQYRFKPGTLNGKVVPVRMTQWVRFRLPKQQSMPPASGDADSSGVLEFYMVEVKPKLLHSVKPVHPEKALRDSLEGTVFVRFMVNDDIEWVKLWGEFCRWRVRSPDIVELVKRDSVWVLPGENPVKEGEGYRFIVNHNTSEVYDLRHSNAKQKSSRLIGFSSIYKGGEIVFDPSVYASPKRDSRAEFSANNGLQATFSRLVKKMKDIRKKGITSYGKMLRSADVWDSTFIDQGNKLREIANQYPPYFEQFILKEKFDFLQRFHPHNRVMRELRSNKIEYETKIKEHYQSAVYESYFSQMVRLAKNIDPRSIFFKTHDTFAFLELDEGLYSAPHLGEKYNMPPFYFTGILVAYERNLSPGTKEGESLLWRMAQHYRDRDHPVAARSAIDQLIQRYPNSKTVLHGSTERLLNALGMQEDRVAPDFVVQTAVKNWLIWLQKNWPRINNRC